MEPADSQSFLDLEAGITLIIASEADVASIGPSRKLIQLGGWSKGELVEVRSHCRCITVGGCPQKTAADMLS